MVQVLGLVGFLRSAATAGLSARAAGAAARASGYRAANAVMRDLYRPLAPIAAGSRMMERLSRLASAQERARMFSTEALASGTTRAVVPQSLRSEIRRLQGALQYVRRFADSPRTAEPYRAIVRVEALNQAGRTGTYTWTFSADAPLSYDELEDRVAEVGRRQGQSGAYREAKIVSIASLEYR